MRHHVFRAARTASLKRGRIFSPSLWYLYFFLGGGTLVILIALFIFFRSTIPNPPLLLVDFLLMLPAFVADMLLMFFGTVLLVFWMRVEVTPEGIIASDKWGIRRTMTWAEIEIVQPATLTGFPCLKLSSFRQSRWALFVPCCMAQPQAFQEAVTHAASPINPLRRALESGGTTQTRRQLPVA